MRKSSSSISTSLGFTPTKRCSIRLPQPRVKYSMSSMGTASNFDQADWTWSAISKADGCSSFISDPLKLVRTDRSSLSFFRQVIVELRALGTDISSWRSVAGLTHSRAAYVPDLATSCVSDVPRGNASAAARGGHHEGRTRVPPTRHQSPSRRPPRQAHLLGAGPLRDLVAQVVGPLPPGRPRGPLRPDTG